MNGRCFQELPHDIHCNSMKIKIYGCFLFVLTIFGQCQTGKFESRVQSNKLSVYKVGMGMEALACHHRTREVFVSEHTKAFVPMIKSQKMVLDMSWGAPKGY